MIGQAAWMKSDGFASQTKRELPFGISGSKRAAFILEPAR
jgi:hypothetical protein